jgi:hypothetical protein
MIDRFSENARLIAVPGASSVLAFFTPTTGFVYALVIMFAFNLFCGMRADGVSIIRCKNFSFGKFKNAIVELLLYFVVIQAIFSVMQMLGDNAESLIIIKTLTYVFIYVYAQNAFKNLIRAYPTNKAFRMIYHIIRFEFKRAFPSHIQTVIERIENEVESEMNK